MKSLLQLFLLTLLLAPHNKLYSQERISFNGCPNGTEVVAPLDTEMEQYMLNYINRVRIDTFLISPLKKNAQLDYAARYHVIDMLSDRYFCHQTYDRTGVMDVNCFNQPDSVAMQCTRFDRLVNFYGSNVNDEVLSMGGAQTLPWNILLAWLNDPPHRNIIQGSFYDIGIGYAVNTQTQTAYWACTFGYKGGSSAPPIMIGLDSMHTTSLNVRLYVSGNLEGVDSIRFSNDSSNWSAWQVMVNNVDWVLAAGPFGKRTVYAELKNIDNGMVYSSSDDIDYVATNYAVQPNSVNYVLSEVYPNPFKEQSAFFIELSEVQHVRIELTNLLGQSVMKIADELLSANIPYYYTIDAGRLPAGIYLLTVKGKGINEVRKVLVE